MNTNLPADLASEQGFLCSVITNPKIIDKSVDRVTEEHFTSFGNREIWKATLALWQERRAVDPITVAGSLEKAGVFEEAGGKEYLTQTVEYCLTPSHWKEYLQNIHECFVRRKIHAAAQKMIEGALDKGKKIEELQENASKDIVSLSATNAENRHISAVLSNCITRWEEAANSGGAVNRGHDSGISRWDHATRGFRPRTLHVIAGAAKAGKTTSALQMVTNPAFEKNVPVALISMEMGAEELLDKYIAQKAKVNISDLLDGRLDHGAHERMSQVIAKSSKLPIYIADEACMTVTQFKARCRRLVSENKVEIIMVDYAQLMEASGDPKNREREVAEVSRTAKILAKELNVCIVLLAQLNDNGAVRESRTFYMDCDSFTKVHKDEENTDPYAYCLTITHNRHGATTMIPVRFVKSQARFEEASYE
jgi:replicative DNA helicase